MLRSKRLAEVELQTWQAVPREGFLPGTRHLASEFAIL